MGLTDSLLTRRAFLGLVETAGKSLLVFAIAGSIHRAQGDSSFSRPPGAREEAVFLSLCLRCDRCRVACPYDIIRPVRITESIMAVGTPILEGYCRNCNRCRPPCPTGALAWG